MNRALKVGLIGAWRGSEQSSASPPTIAHRLTRVVKDGLVTLTSELLYGQVTNTADAVRGTSQGHRNKTE